MYMRSYSQFKNKLLQDRETKKTYNKLGLEFDFIRMLIRKRVEKEFRVLKSLEKSPKPWIQKSQFPFVS